LTVSVLVGGIARVRVHEQESEELKHASLHRRWEVIDVLDTDGTALLGSVAVSRDNASGDVVAEWTATTETLVEVASASSAPLEAKMRLVVTVAPNPFSVSLYRDGVAIASANKRGLMNFEPYRAKNLKPAADAATATDDAANTGADADADAAAPDADAAAAAAAAAEATAAQQHRFDIDGDWNESFGSHTESKPRGPASVAMDVTFHNTRHAFGIPEHAADFALKDTRGRSTDGRATFSSPYRMFNLDVFE
jgi:alpha 1,3-glucosidase